MNVKLCETGNSAGDLLQGIVTFGDLSRPRKKLAVLKIAPHLVK